MVIPDSEIYPSDPGLCVQIASRMYLGVSRKTSGNREEPKRAGSDIRFMCVSAARYNPAASDKQPGREPLGGEPGVTLANLDLLRLQNKAFTT
jgi:hypothetical protein